MSLNFLQVPDTIFAASAAIFLLLILWLIIRVGNFKKIRPIIFLRSGLILFLIFSLSSPMVTRVVKNTRDLPVNIYLDNSLSVGYHQDHSLGTLNTGIYEFTRDLENKNIKYKTYFFSDSVRISGKGAKLNATGQITDLGGVVQHLINEQDNSSAAVIISDGQITRGANPRSTLANLSLPVHTIGLGNTNPLVDVAINSIDVPNIAVKGEEIEALIQISSTGTSEERLNVSLYRENKMVGSRFVDVYGGESISEVRFRFKPENLGNMSYRVQVSSLSDEINIKNNRQSFDLMVLKDEYKVALITGTPSFNTPVIKAIFTAIPRVKIDHYVLDPKKDMQAIKNFWETPYELILLDNFPSVELPVSWQKIFGRKLVAQKSSLFWFIGPNQDNKNSKTIFPFLHIQSSSQLLEKNEKYNWYFNENVVERLIPSFSANIASFYANDLPPIRTGIELESLDSDEYIGATISTGNINVPVLMLGEKESYRFGVWTSPDLSTLFYQLKDSNSKLLVPALFNNVTQWLMRTQGEKDIYFSLNKKRFQQGEQIFLYGNRSGKTNAYTTASVTVSKNDSVIQSTQLQYHSGKDRWEGQFWASAPGEYSYEVEIEDMGSFNSTKGSFTVEESQIELNKVYLNEELLSTISNETNGIYAKWESRAQILQELSFEEKAEVFKKDTKLIENKFWLIFLLLWFTVELAWRRFIGLS